MSRTAPSVGLATKVAFLSTPRSYSEQPPAVETIETHVSWLFLTDHHVFKLKKPVRFDYLDFTTLEARHVDCEEEVRLNRRLAPEVYLGVVALSLGDDGLRMDSGGVVVDWLVKMRRLDHHRLLDVALEHGTAGRADVQRAATYLAEFYRHAAVVPTDPVAYRRRFVDDVQHDGWWLRQRQFGVRSDVVDDAIRPLLGAMDAHAELLEGRAVHVVEGHGDLRPEHVWLGGDRPAVIDCLEFRRDFRLVDPVDELSYLALECERLGASWVESILLQALRVETGDHPPQALVDLYAARRSIMRARLAIWHLRDRDVRSTVRWPDVALQYLELAAARGRQLEARSGPGGGSLCVELDEGSTDVQSMDRLRHQW